MCDIQWATAEQEQQRAEDGRNKQQWVPRRRRKDHSLFLQKWQRQVPLLFYLLFCMFV
jgi:hypothetical protein